MSKPGLHGALEPVTRCLSTNSEPVCASHTDGADEAGATGGGRRLVTVDVRSGKVLRTVTCGFDFQASSSRQREPVSSTPASGTLAAIPTSTPPGCSDGLEPIAGRPRSAITAPRREGIRPVWFIGLSAAGILLTIAGALMLERRDLRQLPAGPGEATEIGARRGLTPYAVAPTDRKGN